MGIPKVIHYCWFGGNPLPKDAKRCIESWKKFCPDYQIIEWNESNFDYTDNLYAKQAMECKRWAFVSDYARLKIVYEQGGIYLDTDVELIRPLDSLLDLEAFFGFESNRCKQEAEVATGLGFGARKGNAVVKAMMEDYETIPFLKEDGTPDMTPCPERNTRVLVGLGLRTDGTRQTMAGAEIFPAEYFCPIGFQSDQSNITKDTYSIHHYHASWLSVGKKLDHHVKKYMNERLYDEFYRPARRWIGMRKYELLKIFKRGGVRIPRPKFCEAVRKHGVRSGRFLCYGLCMVWTFSGNCVILKQFQRPYF